MQSCAPYEEFFTFPCRTPNKCSLNEQTQSPVPEDGALRCGLTAATVAWLGVKLHLITLPMREDTLDYGNLKPCKPLAHSAMTLQ